MHITAEAPPTARNRRNYRRILIGAGVVVLILLAGAATFLAVKWPFTREKIQRELATAASGNIQIQGFQTTYFPPGCVIEGLEFRRSRNLNRPPLLTAAKLRIRANYRNLFRKRIEVMYLEDVRVDMGQKDPTSRSDDSADANKQSGGSGADSNGGSNTNSTT